MAFDPITSVFSAHSGSALLNAGQKIAMQALDNHPLKNSDGSITKNKHGETYVDINKARHSISKQAGQLQERILRDMRGSVSATAAESIKDNIGQLRKYEVARICADVLIADNKSDTQYLRERLNNAMNGLNPANEGQHAMSRVLQTALDKKREPKEDPKERFSVTFDYNG